MSVWALIFRRFIRRKNEEDLWQSYLRIYGLERISQAGELTHLEDIGSGRLLVFKPYALTGFSADQVNGTQALHTGGFDFKYGLRSNLVANLTVNTDFADADVDPQRFNPTPFKILLPEKRPFFLENSRTFLFGDREGTNLFFSRQIVIDPNSGQQVPLDVGAKLTGAAGRFDFGLLAAETRESGPNPQANYAVARMKTRVLSVVCRRNRHRQRERQRIGPVQSGCGRRCKFHLLPQARRIRFLGEDFLQPAGSAGE